MEKIRRYKLRTPATKKTYRVRYEDELNSEQLEVVMAGDGPILVIAGAGSGKTRTLTYRVSRLIEDGVDPSDILLLTFTNKASREMLSRVEELVTIDTRTIWGGTFHSVGNRILRAHAEVIGYRRNFSILDDEDAKQTMDSSISESGIETLKKRFPKGDVLLDIYSYVLNTRTPIATHVEQNHPHFLPYLPEMQAVFRRYAEKKREANAMDFDDLLLNWKILLEQHPEVAEPLKLRFRHVLVDEYQDTNRMQAEIVDRMVSARRNVMVVGDDAQSIYSFRGASFENIITFPLRFPDAAIYKLETNYRSTPQILSLANAAIAHNRYQFPKELSAVRADGPDPAMVGVDDVYEQARFVGSRILELRDEGENLGDIAVLYRSHYQSLELQMELSRMNIPYEIRSGVRFFEQAHIKDVVAYLKILANPKDELSWKRMLKLHPKVGEVTATKVWQSIGRESDPLQAMIRGGGAGHERVATRTMDNVRRILRLLDSDSMRRSPSEAIRLIVDEGYREYAQTRFPNAQARLDDLEQLAQYALRYADVDTFLAEVVLTTPIAGEDIAAAGAEDEKIVLSSVHQAKGLEWRIVFVIWLAEGRFPSARALRVPGGSITLRRGRLALPGLTDAATEEIRKLETEMPESQEQEIVIPGEEEERRLFYVAVTRARQELYLVYPAFARDRAQFEVLMEPSRFVRELPEGLYEKWIIGE
ncbi:MAG: ATP-dependent helicase [Thermoanaerobaculia bacterium]